MSVHVAKKSVICVQTYVSLKLALFDCFRLKDMEEIWEYCFFVLFCFVLEI